MLKMMKLRSLTMAAVEGSGLCKSRKKLRRPWNAGYADRKGGGF